MSDSEEEDLLSLITINKKRKAFLIPWLQKGVDLWNSKALSLDQEKGIIEILDSLGRVYIHRGQSGPTKIFLMFEKVGRLIAKANRPLLKKEYEAFCEAIRYFKGEIEVPDLVLHTLTDLYVKLAGVEVHQDKPAYSDDIFAVSKEAWELYLEDFQEQVEIVTTILLRAENQSHLSENEGRDILKTLHRIKGASRMLQIGTICEVIHELESLLAIKIKEKKVTSQSFITLFYTAFDLIEEMSFLPFREVGKWLDKNKQRFEAVKKAASNFIHKEDRGEEVGIALEGDVFPLKMKGQTFRMEPGEIEEVLTLGKKTWIEFHSLYDFQANLLFSEKSEKVLHDYSKRYQKALTELDALYKGLLNLKLCPISQLLRIYPKMVRQLALKSGKKVVCEISGGTHLISRELLRLLETPLIHITRNAIDHGIETPTKRLSAGKPEQGKIKLKVENQNGWISIEVVDDGSGIDLETIRTELVKCGRMNQQEAKKLSAKELLDAIYLTGFSTSKDLTEVSGRGIGMDLVLEQVQKAGGKLEVFTKPGEGTRFLMTFPASLSTYPASYFSSGGETLALFETHPLKITPVSKDRFYHLSKKDEIEFDGEKIPYLRLCDQSEELHILENSEGKKVAVLGSLIEEKGSCLVQKESQLKYFDKKGFLGLSSNERLLVYAIDFNLLAETGKGHARKALVVDDSKTVRTQVKMILNGLGYEVTEADCGYEALKILLNTPFDLATIDWQMPKMSGKEILGNIQEHKKLRNLPTIVISSLDPQKPDESFSYTHWVKKDSNLPKTLEKIVGSPSEKAPAS